MILRVFKNISEWLGHRVAIRELQRLDDQALTDIGVTRDGIPRAVARGLR